MAKILEAICQDNHVKVGDLQIDGVEILTNGAGQSSGLLIIDGSKTYYVTTNTTDLSDAIDKIEDGLQATQDAITQIATTLTSIGAGMTGPTTAPPPTLATDVVAINSKATLVGTAKSDLDTVKGNLK